MVDNIKSIPFGINEDAMHAAMERHGNDPDGGMDGMAKFLLASAEADPRVQAVGKDVTEFAEEHLQKLLGYQTTSALRYYDISADAVVCTEGATYLIWPSQFKVTGITVVDMEKVPEGSKVNVRTPFAAIHHDAEYSIETSDKGIYAKRCGDKFHFVYSLQEVPSVDALIDMAKEKAIRYRGPIGI